MMKFIKNKLKEEKGLTLIELLAVIVILGIIAAIAIPAIGNIITNSRVNALKADGQNVLAAANIYFTDNGVQKDGTVTINELLSKGYLDDAGGFPTGENNGVSVKKVEGGNQISGTASYKGGTPNVKFTNATNNDIKQAGTKADESVNGKVDITR